ncbi:MAG: hypothetical protein VX963_05555 [Actinomycetota bacterium]|nr:hypothetical protein [Actinomycetota bacterium]
MTDIRATRLFVVLVGMAVMAASCGSDPDAKVASSSPATALAVVEPDDNEDSSNIEIDDPHNLRFDPAKWDEIPDWWLEIQDVPFDRLWRPQSTQRIETPPSDHQASEMHLGDRVLMWYIPEDWVENCISSTCSYGPDGESPGTKGFVVGWGGTKPRTSASDPATNGSRLTSSELRTYVAGETQPLDCEANKDQGDPEADDMYPEPWFLACVGTIDEFTIARVEMFRLDEDCEPYGNSYGAWIGWENAYRSNIDLFVESLADQMLADRIECVTPETLFAQDYAYWDVSSSSLAGSTHEISRIWVAELQRRIGAEPDGVYGPQTLDMHFEAVKDITPLPVVPMISSGPCGIFKFVLSNWPFEGLISRWSAGSGWMPTLDWRNASLNLYDPPAVVSGWWYGEEKLVPPPPDWVDTADVTGDGVNDFILRWSGPIQSVTAVATIHEKGSNCSWRYVGEYGNGPLYYRLYPESHDYWNVSYKAYGDTQGNHCVLNQSYARYNVKTDSFEPTFCEAYSELFD